MSLSKSTATSGTRPSTTTKAPKGRRPGASPLLSLPAGVIGLQSDDPPLEWVALQGEDPVRVSQGYGGWEPVDRPRQVSVTQWTKSQPFLLTAAFMLDGFAARDPVERECRILERMGTRDTGDPSPPILRFFGPVHAAYLKLDWVIQDIDWTDPTIVSSRTGDRLRQAGTVTLLQHVDGELLGAKSAAEKQREKSKSKRGHNTRAKHGDTLEKIAARTHSKVAELRKLNPKIRDPGRAISPGTVIRVP